MIIYLLVISIILLLNNNLKNSFSKKNERLYCYIVFSILIILAAIRYVIPGTDASGYVEYYNAMNSLDWSEVSQKWNRNYVAYFYLCKAFSYTHLPYQFWFGFVELLYITGFLRLINKFSVDKLFSIFLFFTIGLFTFSFYGLKQVVAMAFVWHAFAFFNDKKYFSAAIFSLIAFYCHKTSAFFILSYLLALLKNLRFFNIIIASLAIIIIAAPSLLFSFLANSVEDEHYLLYMNDSSEATHTVMILYSLLFVIACYYSLKKDYPKTVNDKMVMGLAFVSVVVQLLSQVSGTAFRLALYYTPFLLIMLSNNVKNKSVRICVIIFMTIFMLYTGRSFPYRFFWQ